MLTQIDVVYENELGEQALALPILGVTPKDSLLIRQVTGLNPPDRDLFIGDYARDGGLYQGSRVGNRNVVMMIDMNPNPALGESVSGLRDLLYKTFMDPLVYSDSVELVLHDDDGRVRNLVGYTEKLETEIFGVETMAQVSMICPDPYLRDVAETALVNTTGTWTTVPFSYSGTSETGFEAEIRMSADHSRVVLENNGRAMTIVDTLLATQTLYVNTSRGSRDILAATTTQVDATHTANPTWTLTQVWEYLRANAFTTPKIAKLTSDSPWLELHSQSNLMKVHGVLATDLIAGVKRLSYRASYWGI